MAYTFTPIATDTFQRPDENPIDPANWNAAAGSALAIVSHNCVPAVNEGGGVWFGDEPYTGAVFTSNQYISVVVGAVDISAAYFIDLVLDTPIDYSSENDVFLAGDGTGNYTISLLANGMGTVATYSLPSPPVTGDVLLGGIFNGTIFAYYNGVQVVSAPCTPGPGLIPWLSLQSATSETAASVTKFTAGTVSSGIVTPPFSPVRNTEALNSSMLQLNQL